MSSGPFFRPVAQYLVSVLNRLGYRPRLRVFASPDAYFNSLAHSPLGFQAALNGWNADYPSAFEIVHPLLTCATYQPRALDYTNLAGFCDKGIDDEIARASALQTSKPGAAAVLWSKIDRDVVDAAPWAPFGNAEAIDFVSRRVGNYQYNPQWGVLLDQMWVH